MQRIDDKERLQQSYTHWRRRPLDWVRDKFSQAIKDGRLKLTGHLCEALNALGSLIDAKMKRAKGEKLSEAEEVLVKKIGISIMSGQGCGKDTFAALVVLFFLDCFPDAKIPCTGVNAQHLRSVLWAEIATWMAAANRPKGGDHKDPTCLQGILTWQTATIYHNDNKAAWFAEAITINRNSSRDEQSKTLYGRHAKAMLIVLDEADGIPDVVFGPIEGTLTGVVNLALCIFNPTRSSGYAYDTQFKLDISEKWLKLHWNAEDSEMVTKEHVAGMAIYGVDSFKYRVRVLGLPPLANSNTLIPDAWIFDAIGREIEPFPNDPIIAGIDVGGGGDKSVMCLRQGGKILRFLYNNDKDPMAVVHWIVSQMAYYDVRAGIVDVVGLGAGIYSRLLEMGQNVRPWDSRNTSRYPEKYYNRRTEMYMNLRQLFADGVISLPDDCPDLQNELKVIGYAPEQKCKVDLKEVIRKSLGGDSPDSADACALSVAYPDEVFRTTSSSLRNRVQYRPMGII